MECLQFVRHWGRNGDWGLGSPKESSHITRDETVKSVVQVFWQLGFEFALFA